MIVGVENNIKIENQIYLCEASVLIDGQYD